MKRKSIFASGLIAGFMALFMTPASGVTTVNAAVEPEQITVSSETALILS